MGSSTGAVSVAAFGRGGSRYDHCELWDGAVVVREAPGTYHGGVAQRILTRLAVHVETSHAPGRVLASDTGFAVSRRPPRVLAPDGAYVSFLRLPTLPAGFAPCAPEFLVEVRSPRDSLEHQHRKAGLWIAHGAEVVWVVDPDTKTITVHRALEAPVIVRGDERADARPALPGFSMPASDAFAGL